MTEREEALEEAAKVADSEIEGWHDISGNPARRIARAIRALASSPPPKGGDEQARPMTASAPTEHGNEGHDQ
jgi:hypothetical protein